MPPLLDIKLLTQQAAAVGHAIEVAERNEVDELLREDAELLRGVWNFCHELLERADVIRRPDGTYGLLTIELFPVNGDTLPSTKRKGSCR